MASKHYRDHQLSLYELCINYLCENLRHFAPREECEFTKKFVVAKRQQQQQRFEELDTDAFVTPTLENIPSKPSQQLINTLCSQQLLTFPLLLQLCPTQFSQLNLFMNGRVRNEWMILIREMRLVHLNLSHCLITNDSLFYLRKKQGGKRKKKKKKQEEGLKPTSPTQEKNHKSLQQREREKKHQYMELSVPAPLPAQQQQQQQQPMLAPRKENFPLTDTLSSLNISYNHVLSYDGLHVITKKCKQLRTLCLEGCAQVNNKCLEDIGKTLFHLSALNVKRCTKISSYGIKCLAPLTKLEVLNLSELDKITCDALESLSLHNLNLAYLNLRGNIKLRQQGIDSLCTMQQLRTLDIVGIPNCTSLQFLSNFTESLTSLSISDLSIQEEKIQSIATLTRLKCLNMAGNKTLTPSYFAQILKPLGNLIYLDVCKTSCSDYCLEILSTYNTNLSKLNISYNSNISDHGFEHYLSKITSLIELNARQLTEVTNNGWSYVFRSLTNLQVLDISENEMPILETDQPISSSAFLQLHHLRMLQVLLVSGCQSFDDASLKIVSEQLTRITCLDISDTPQITSKGLEFVSGMSQLIQLTIRHNTLIVDSFELLQHCSNLESLDLSSCKVQFDDLKQITTKLSNLTSLSLMNCPLITSKCVHQLKHLSKLQNLNLYGIPLTDSGVAHLQKLTSLNVLRIADSKLISDEGFGMLHQLPNLVYLKQKKLEIGAS